MTLISYFLFMRNINLDKFIKFKSIFLIIICISFLGLLIKNVSRIYNTDNISIYPSLINFDRVSIVQEVFDLDNEFTHYKSLGGAECGVSKSPCTHFDVNIKKILFLDTRYLKLLIDLIIIIKCLEDLLNINQYKNRLILKVL